MSLTSVSTQFVAVTAVVDVAGAELPETVVLLLATVVVVTVVVSEAAEVAPESVEDTVLVELVNSVETVVSVVASVLDFVGPCPRALLGMDSLTSAKASCESAAAISSPPELQAERTREIIQAESMPFLVAPKLIRLWYASMAASRSARA